MDVKAKEIRKIRFEIVAVMLDEDSILAARVLKHLGWGS